MSNFIVCHECQSQNAPGSKFCNNCGTRLSTASELICPNCQTSNPPNRVYCDACGTRLVKEEFREDHEAAGAGEPSQPSGEAFSLPTRKPGETGDLDPSALPDWLRTGTSPLDEEEAPSTGGPESGKLPKIEDLTPEKKSTDDLPEWLVSENDSDPIIEPPPSISTDDFIELVGQSTAGGPESAEESAVESDASLPDWLADSVQAETMPPSGDDESLTEDAPNRAETPGWQEELGPVDTGILARPVDEEGGAFEELPTSDDEMPDWIAELGSTDTSILSEPLGESTGRIGDEADEDEVDEDWMADFDLGDANMLSLTADDVDDKAEVPSVESDRPLEWPRAAELDARDAIDADGLEKSEILDSPISGQEREDLDWSLGSQFPAPEASTGLDRSTAVESEELARPDTGELPAWLDEAEDESDLMPSPEIAGPTGIADEVTAPGSRDLPDWLTDEVDLSPGAPSGEVAATDDQSDVMPAAEKEELPDWLLESEGGELEGARPDTGDIAGALASDEVDGDERVKATGELWEWVGELDATATSIEREEERDEIGADETLVDEQLSGWMEELDPSGTGFFSGEGDAFTGGVADSDVGTSDLYEELARADETAVDEPVPDTKAESDHRDHIDVDAVSVSSWFAEIDGGIPPSEIDEREDIAASLLESDDEMWAGLEWLSGEGAREPEQADDGIADEASPDVEEPMPPETDITDTDEATLADVPDWLNQLAALDLDASVANDIDAPADVIGEEQDLEEETLLEKEPAERDAVGEPDYEEKSVIDKEEISSGSPGADWLSGDSLLEELPEGEEMPDWLEQLGPPVPDQTIVDQMPDEIEPAEEALPDWVAKLKPRIDSETGSLLPTALSLSGEDESALDDLTDELGAPELPAWLSGGVGESRVDRASAAATPDTSGWFRTDEEDVFADAFSFDEDSESPPDSEWSNVLSDLPPAVAPEDLLIRADIPEWVQRLKPREMTGSGEPIDTAQPAEVSGPLAGLAGVVGVDSIIAVPRQARPVGGFIVTREQQQQAVLLNRLTQWQREISLVTRERVVASAAVIRVVLAVLLIATVIGAFYLPDLLQAGAAPVSQEVEAAGEAVNAAAGRPVVIALEYTPALRGELMPQAEILLDQLEANGSPVVYLSQYAAGMAMATELGLGQDNETLGYVPGEAIGLRQLARCLGSDTPCQEMFGRAIDADVQRHLQDVGLVVVLTGERDSLVYWVEQVGAFNQVPMIAGVTQSLAPIAGSYLASGQLSGLIAGRSDGAAYQRELHQTDTTVDLQQQLNVQQLTQLLFASLLVLGGLIYGIGGQRGRKTEATSGVV